MNTWKIASALLALALVAMGGALLGQQLAAWQSTPSKEHVESYITAADEWLHAEFQMKSAIGTGLNAVRQAPEYSDPATQQLLDDINSLAMLEPPTVPDAVSALNADGDFNGDFAPLKEHVQHLNISTIEREVTQLRQAREKADERARTLGRLTQKLEKHLHTSTH